MASTLVAMAFPSSLLATSGNGLHPSSDGLPLVAPLLLVGMASTPEAMAYP